MITAAEFLKWCAIFKIKIGGGGGGSGTVTSITAGTGLSGGTITTSGTISLATIAPDTIMSNLFGTSTTPTGNTLTIILDTILGAIQGDIIYRNATQWTVLGAGTTGQFLQTQGTSSNPQWASPAGSGTINAGSIGQVAYYAATGTVISGTNTLPIGLTIPGYLPNTLISTNIFVGNSSNIATGVSLSGDASISNTGILTLDTVNSNVGTFGNSTNVGQFTVNAKGLITAASNIAISGAANPWIDETSSAVSMVTNTGYTSDDGATLVTFTLPTIAGVGDWLEVNGLGSGLYKIAQNSGQQIVVSGVAATTTGITGYLASVNQYDCVRLRCLVANTIFTVVSQQSTGMTVF